MKNLFFLLVLTPSFVLANEEFLEEKIILCDFLNKHAIIPFEDSEGVSNNRFTPDMINKIKQLKLLPSDDYIIFPPCFVLLEYLEILDISDNNFYLLPPEIEKLKSLKLLYIENTCFCHIVLKGLEGVMDEILELLSEDSGLLSDMKKSSKNKDFKFLIILHMYRLKEKNISLGSCLEALFLYKQEKNSGYIEIL